MKNVLLSLAIGTICLLLVTPLSAEQGSAEPKTYGLGLPRDLDTLSIPDEAYPHWPLRKEQAAYSDVSGARMKEWVHKISAVSLRSKQDGNMYWGRLPGTTREPCIWNIHRNSGNGTGCHSSNRCDKRRCKVENCRAIRMV